MHYPDEGRIIWKRLDVPGHESAWVFADDGNWILDGSAVFLWDRKVCRLDYLIECDDAWNTAAATVNGWVGDDVVDVEIEVASGERWTINGEPCPEVDGSIDIDLNFSPVTNTLPIRRLDLSEGGSERVRSAWLRFPSFKLEALAQTYTRLAKATYRYESGTGTFVRELEVDEFGLVTDYPDYWKSEIG
jgi:hypothetical protein